LVGHSTKQGAIIQDKFVFIVFMYTDLVGHSTKQGAIIQDKFVLHLYKNIFWLTAKVKLTNHFKLWHLGKTYPLSYTSCGCRLQTTKVFFRHPVHYSFIKCNVYDDNDGDMMIYQTKHS